MRYIARYNKRWGGITATLVPEPTRPGGILCPLAVCAGVYGKVDFTSLLPGGLTQHQESGCSLVHAVPNRSVGMAGRSEEKFHPVYMHSGVIPQAGLYR